MDNFIIRKVAVLGAGVMGAQIAAHLANADVPVVLFDLPAKEGKCGGEVESNTLVPEQWILDVERARFVDLLKTDKTQQRIVHMLETGKPLRN